MKSLILFGRRLGGSGSQDSYGIWKCFVHHGTRSGASASEQIVQRVPRLLNRVEAGITTGNFEVDDGGF
jgi:hypothetical protein